MKRKHILFIVENNAFPNDVRVYREAKAASEFGYQVSVIAPTWKKEKKFEVVDGIDVYRHPLPVEGGSKLGLILEYANALFWELFLAIKVYLKKPFHAIHAANPPDHIFIIAFLFKLSGVKYIFDHHDICPENYVAKFSRMDFLYKFLMLFEKFTFRVANIVISTNESYKKIAIGRGRKHPDDVFVVRNGPDKKSVIFSPPNDQHKRGAAYLVGYVGTIGNQEGIDNLLYAVEHLVFKLKRTDIRFIIVGTGTDWQNMVDLSLKLGLQDYVHFTGYIPYKTYWEIIASCDLCVNPEFRNSFTDYSTMLKIMDYLVMSKPVLQYFTIEGQVTAGEAAVYVHENDITRFADALIKLLDNPAQREVMSNVAKERMENILLWKHQKVNLQKAYAYLFG